MANELTYQSDFTGEQMDERFRAVATLAEALTVLEQAIAAKYTKPADGIPSTDMDASVQAALAKAESAVQSLADYYTKSEVDQLLAAINGMDYVDVSTLPTASASTMGKIYLLGPDASGYYAYYYTSYDGTNYSWVGPLGTTEISLAGYATKDELNQLDQEVNGLDETLDDTNWEHKNIQSSLQISSNDSWRLSPAIAVTKGIVFEINSAGNQLYCLAACSANGQISSGLVQLDGASDVNKVYTYTIQSDGYVRVSYKKSITGAYAKMIIVGLREDVEKNTEDIATLCDTLSTEVTESFYPTASSGTYWDTNGSQGSSANWESYQIELSQYIGKTITFKVHGQAGGVAFNIIQGGSGTTIWKEAVGAVDYEHTFLVDQDMIRLLVSNRKATGTASFFVTNKVILTPEGKRNNLDGEKVSIIGDSITYGSSASDSARRYSTLFCKKYGAVENNLGVAATGIANNMLNGTSGQRFVTRATAANLQDSKLIIVFGGTNDFSYDSKAIGDLFAEGTITPDGYIGSKQKAAVADTDTFAGALHDLISTIRTNCPNVPIVFLTPLKRGRYMSGRPTSYESNQWGDYLDDFCAAIKEICAYYSIPVLDLNAKSELDFSNASIATAFSADSLHPNDAGHAIIAELLYRFVEDNVV